MSDLPHGGIVSGKLVLTQACWSTFVFTKMLLMLLLMQLVYTFGTHCSAHPIRAGSTHAVRQCIFLISMIKFSCAAGSRDNTLRVWNVQTAHTIKVLEGHEYQVRNLLFDFAFATSSIVNRTALAMLQVPANGQVRLCCRLLV